MKRQSHRDVPGTPRFGQSVACHEDCCVFDRVIFTIHQVSVRPAFAHVEGCHRYDENDDLQVTVRAVTLLSDYGVSISGPSEECFTCLPVSSFYVVRRLVQLPSKEATFFTMWLRPL